MFAPVRVLAIRGPGLPDHGDVNRRVFSKPQTWSFELLRRMLVVDGVSIVSTEPTFPSFSKVRVWIPSSIHFLFSTLSHSNLCSRRSSSDLQEVAIEFGSHLQQIDKEFFHCDIAYIFIPNSVFALRHSCFSKCKSLTDVRFEGVSALREIGEQLFLLWLYTYSDP
jgi:hypothetical protein